MQPDSLHSIPPHQWLRIRHKLVSSYMLVTLGTVLLTAGIAFGASLLLAGWPSYEGWGQGHNIVLGTVLVTLVSFLLGLWASRPLDRRLERVLAVCRAWLRGNLALRIGDPVIDDLGLIAGQLDILAKHLEQDEQDLAKLSEYNARVTDQVRALAVDEERDRLARELHDGVKQHLFSLSMTASAIRTHLEGQSDTPPAVQEMVQEVETTSKTVQRELTRLIENLRPGTLEEKGLAAALDDYTLLFGAREHILTYLDVHGNDALVPPSVAESLYRVAQEALHNVARHARATRIDVQLRCLAEQVTLTLADNGTGFDASQPRRGLGLGNMQDRMMSIGGRLSIDSKAGSGTRVRAEVGLARPLGAQTEIAKPTKDRPNPTIENWAWLGQRLVIPVGQVWPWLPADERHLRQPLVEPGETRPRFEPSSGFFGLGRCYSLQWATERRSSICVRHRLSGSRWKHGGATWKLQRIHGPKGLERAVLTCNGQPLAALQSQGRLLNTWTEIIYDDRGYRLSEIKEQPGTYLLADRENEELVQIKAGAAPQIKLYRALPLPLLAMAAIKTISEQSAHPIRRERQP